MEASATAALEANRQRTTLIVVALSLAIFLVSLDTVVITTALPTIAAQFHLNNSEYAWIGSAYLLSNAASIPIWGRISDIFGRKLIILLANVFFLAGSIISALSPNGRALIAGRAIQGFGGGGIGALVNIIIGDLFDLRTRSLVYGIIGAIWAVSCSIGPLIGAGFTQNVKWPWIFWINLPIDLVSIVLIMLCLSAPSSHTPFWSRLKHIDWFGSATIIAATISLLLGLQFGGVTYAWGSAIVICLIITGAAMFALFFYLELFVAGVPLIPMRVLSNKSVLCALLVTCFDAFVFNSVSFFIPLYFQNVVMMSPIRSGVLMLPMALPLSTVSIASGWFMERSGRVVELLRAGLFLMVLGTGLLLSLPFYLDLVKVIPFLFILGVGFGPNFQAPLLIIQARLQPQDMVAGTTTFGFVRMLSGAIGIVLCQVVYQTNHSSVNADEELGTGLGSKITAIRHVWILLCVTSFVGLVLSLGIKRQNLQNSLVLSPENREMDRLARSIRQGEC